MSDSEQILDLEKRFWEAADATAYQEDMTDQAVIVMEPAGFLTKQNAVEMAQQGNTGFTGVRLQDVKTIELNPDCAVIAYHGEGTSRQGKKTRSTVSSTYVRENGQWKLAMTTHQPWPEDKG